MRKQSVKLTKEQIINTIYNEMAAKFDLLSIGKEGKELNKAALAVVAEQLYSISDTIDTKLSEIACSLINIVNGVSKEITKRKNENTASNN